MSKKTPEQMTLVALRPMRVDGKPVAVAQKVTTSRQVGLQLVGMGKAREVEAAKGKKGGDRTLTTEDAAPLVRSGKAEG